MFQAASHTTTPKSTGGLNSLSRNTKRNGLLLLLLVLALVPLKGQEKIPTIVDRPIAFDVQRKALSLAYLQDRYGLIQQEPTITPKMIVLHWTAIPTLERSFKAFDPVTLPNWRPEIASAGALNVSAHFLVDRDGTIYRLLPETTMARHVIGLNHCAIGVENVGGTADTPMTKAQVKANIDLVRYLTQKYAIQYVIAHAEYTLFEGHELWLERDSGYRTVKNDPDIHFMEQVREGIRPIPLKPLPKPDKNDE